MVPTLGSASSPDSIPDRVGGESIADDILLLLALLSIVLILALATTTTLSVFWTGVIYIADFVICALFAMDFAAELAHAQSKRGYLRTRWYELFAMLPVVVFAYAALPILIAAILRALRLGRFVMGISHTGGRALDRRSKRRLEERHLVSYVAAAIIIALFVVLFRDELLKFQTYGQDIVSLLISAIIIAGALAFAEIIIILGVSRIDDLQTRDTIERVVFIAIVGLAAVAIASFIFQEILIVFGTLGVVGLILSFSLSPVIGNFIGWVYISTERPFSLGDRIVLGNANGIVERISYLTTTLQEVGGDPPSSSFTGGRVTVPNSLVLSSVVATFKTAIPGTTSSLTFEIGYESDIKAVKEMIERTVVNVLKKIMESPDVKGSAKEDQLAKAKPQVVFSPSQTWIIARVTYTTLLSKADLIRSAITEEILNEFRANPDKVKFPRGDSR